MLVRQAELGLKPIRGERALSRSSEAVDVRVHHWHALRSHFLLIAGVSDLAVKVGLLVVATTKALRGARGNLSIQAGRFAQNEPRESRTPSLESR
jgi:hypothetical protein